MYILNRFCVEIKNNWTSLVPVLRQTQKTRRKGDSILSIANLIWSNHHPKHVWSVLLPFDSVGTWGESIGIALWIKNPQLSRRPITNRQITFFMLVSRFFLLLEVSFKLLSVWENPALADLLWGSHYYCEALNNDPLQVIPWHGQLVYSQSMTVHNLLSRLILWRL